MKTKEFNLSEKMHTSTLDIAKAKKEHIGYFKREDVKEFIKKLKEELLKRQIIVDVIIDSLAGDKLR